EAIAEVSQRGTGEAVEATAGQVAERVARERVQGQEEGIAGQDERSDADPEPAGPAAGMDHVDRQDDQEDERQVEEVAMEVLDREPPRFALVRRPAPQPAERPGLAHAATDRVEEEGPVIGLAVVVARDPEAPGRPEDQGRR